MNTTNPTNCQPVIKQLKAIRDEELAVLIRRLKGPYKDDVYSKQLEERIRKIDEALAESGVDL